MIVKNAIVVLFGALGLVVGTWTSLERIITTFGTDGIDTASNHTIAHNETHVWRSTTESVELSRNSAIAEPSRIHYAAIPLRYTT